jgi:DNA repair protein RadC
MRTMVYDRHTLEALLANSLREKTDSYTVKAILDKYTSLFELLDASEQELQQISGIGYAKARQIKAVLELGRLLAVPPKQERQTIRSPQDAFELFRYELAHLQQEHFIIAGLNTKNHVLFKHTVTIGTLNASLVHPREVFRPLIRHAAASCIVAHNHPSGDSTPSREDITVTKRLQEAGEIIGIDVLDHIVCGVEEFTSLKERGFMDGGKI